jgi:hypothetical protein
MHNTSESIESTECQKWTKIEVNFMNECINRDFYKWVVQQGGPDFSIEGLKKNNENSHRS